ncbi:FAM72 protein-domain-containing protein [Mycena sanguinolenta]|nr:FAM72 protein-domain-containing protein [Mycena sanguinolenta]
MFSYYPWQPFPASHYNPYAPPPPPPVPHKVWILDCKTCGTFLTNRGMKAVLLLRPNVALYSSDALPINASASDRVISPPACSSSSTHPLRTCECLTQTLCCHGCGNAIGYMIVIPCARCTSSISTTNRATNGHRFVFHSGEILGTERRYITDEPGVISIEATPSPTVFAPYSAAALHNGLHNRLHNHRSPVFYPHHSQTSAARLPEYLPTPPLDVDDASPTSSNAPSPTVPSFPFDSSRLATDSPLPQHYLLPFSDHFHAHYPQLSHSHAPRPSRNRATSAASSESSSSSPPPLIPASPAFGLPAEHYETPVIPPLQAGDVLYWHHLVKHGEIPAVKEDTRARRRSLAINSGKTKMHFDR